jgi:hypothetical protein
MGAHQARSFVGSNIFGIAFPAQRIAADVFTDRAEFAFIAHDVFPKVSLPQLRHADQAPDSLLWPKAT